MAIIKCKMCGGNIEVSADKTYGTCDSCGSTITLPRINNQRMENLFNRANHFRMICEFDKAVATYDMILNEDDTDAEAHWGLLISRLGIEYVEDPSSHERIPTSHRIQKDSILTDSDYLAALEYAPDTYTRSLYEEEGKRLAELQRSMLAVSAQSEPYDIFICYKETDASGNRTKDSALAQDIYYQLKNAGYRVFFARVSLEDKLGQQYEPHIFAALNSAKVMLVIGTNPEYFTAVWVRNEWSRFLALAKKDRSKMLIPCYRDINVYDLPDELSMLQSQDMGKIGFIQDLLRGIQKLLSVDKNIEKVQVNAAINNSISPLLRRAFLFLEDEEWETADSYFERVLDADPENARAYIGKMLVQLRIKNENDLENQDILFNENPFYRKAMRFADEEYRTTLESYTKALKRENERKQQAYSEARNCMSRATLPEQFRHAAKLFGELEDYSDAFDKQKECMEKAENAKKSLIYESAVQRINKSSDAKQLKCAIQELKSLGAWKDAPKQIERAEKQLRTIVKKLKNRKLLLKLPLFYVTVQMIISFVMVAFCIVEHYGMQSIAAFFVNALILLVIRKFLKKKVTKYNEQINSANYQSSIV